MNLIEAFTWVLSHKSTFMIALNQHLWMCIVAMSIGAVIAIPLGFFVAHSRRASFIAINIVGAFRSIPSLAILSAALPFLGIGFLPSVVALIVLAVPPLLLNTVVGVAEVDATVTDAATGMGMSRLQIAMKIELPLALGPIISGVKIASIQVIGGAALASFVGGGGLGDFISTGIAIMDMPRLLVGAVPIALLAIAAEVGFSFLERRVSRRTVNLSGDQ
ncbi:MULTISPECIES: ABC transporter permease [Rhodobacterales]|uniref:ABC transporter permease n=1 Tax=Roseobacter sp. N2S TaxID=2663844 RepID=UPI00285FDEF5|nr:MULTISPECIES: ABC transporter permease [Rhodobacterales]MDR6266819.1 osmoprotectant transport system permease protein [Roseobacter sp. N2S]